ncbi:hypothetical protein [Natronorubrum sulfidifaciens]|uniref:NADH dehydrogenase-like complex subunit J2 n=1 Tax=Natronorubrum sulfidifaciens JCM 14089 TaxID=1230460 RepID=L9W5M4_9EURY|nr:hypothetical protein [Natronorubrum sulfidifaciens]ELY44566.1 hypothetical protein C495_11714 [Natronorubrum sulfidifaciens JCM 14089]
MTTGPQLRLGKSLLPGVLAVGLFGLMALIVLNTSFSTMATAGYPDGISITSEIGYAMFNLEVLQSTDGSIGATEPFLAAFLLVAITLDAALDASLVLAKREEDGEPVSPLGSSSPEHTEQATDSSRFSRSGSTTDGGASGTDSSGGDDR